jgi:hypothetical protein
MFAIHLKTVMPQLPSWWELLIRGKEDFRIIEKHARVLYVYGDVHRVLHRAVLVNFGP